MGLSSRWPLRDPLAPAVTLCAALPVIVATIRAVADGWVPVGDQGIVATRAYDVFTHHAPLVGQYSLASDEAGHATHSPGPLLYWLLAVPARLGAPASLTLVMGLVNVAAIVGIVALARRRGGTSLMLLAAGAIILMSRSFSPESLHDIFNPSAALFPFALLILLCWSVACGDHRLVPLTVLVASFVAQCHLAFVPPTAGLLLVAATGLRRARARRSLLAGLAVGLLCWGAPLADQIANRPGNLSLLATAATSRKTTQGAGAGWRALSRTIGITPRWLRAPSSTADRLSGISGGDYGDTRLNDVLRPANAAGTASTIAVLLGLVAAAVVGVRSRRTDLAAGAAIGLVLCAALAGVVSSTPIRATNTLGYTLWWGSVVGMWAWVFLVWSAGVSVPARAHRAVAAALPAVAVAVVVGAKPDQHLPDYRPARAISARLAGLPRGQTVLVVSSGPALVPIQPAVMFALRRQGVRPLGASVRLGPWYALDHRRYVRVVRLHEDAAHRPVVTVTR